MAGDFLGIPLDFAQGILSMRSALAQKAAELQDLKEARAHQTLLAQMQQDTQMRGQDSAAAIAAGNQAVDQQRNEIAAAQAQAQVTMWTKEFEQQREAIQEKVMLGVSKGEITFIPPWMKLPPEALQGPEVVGTDGQKKPSYTGTLLDTLNGQGSFFVPLTNERESAAIQKTMGEIASMKKKDALTLANLHLALARAAKAEKDANSPVTASPGLLSFVQRSVDSFMTGARALMLLKKESRDPKDIKAAKEIESDPTKAYTGDVAESFRNLLNYHNAFTKKLGGPATEDKWVPGQSLDPMSIFMRQQILDALDWSSPAVQPTDQEVNAARMEQQLLKEGVQRGWAEPGMIDLQKGTFTPGKPTRLGPGQGAGYRVRYHQNGQEIGHELFSLQGGRYVGGSGRTPHSAPPAASPASGPAAIPGPIVPAAPTGNGNTPTNRQGIPGLSQEEADWLESLRQKDGAFFGTPEGAAAIQRMSQLEQKVRGAK